MAKSLFEPKRVPKYTENIIKPATGLQAAPTPPRQRSVSTGTPKLAQATPTPPVPAPVAPPTPAVSSAPPTPAEETRAFSFDGATELTGSFSTGGGSRFMYGTVHCTVRPGWSSTETGSFTIFSINNPTDNTDYKRSFEFTRTSGSSGYQDNIVVKFSSGSEHQSRTIKNPLSPNFYSGSVGFKFYQISFTAAGMLGDIRVGKDRYYPTNRTIVDTATSSTKVYNGGKTTLNSTDYEMTVGGLNSGSNGYFKGEIANLAVSKNTFAVLGSTMARNVEVYPNVDIVYKFEGNLLASKGNQDLGVAGTETYVSSSI